MKNYYLHGSWNAICQSCGRKFKAVDMRRRWDGLLVCMDDFEYRQPQDFVRARVDHQTPPWTSPRPGDVFIHTQGVQDTFTMSDQGQEYIDPSYFASDYILDQAIVISVGYTRGFTDTVTVTDNIAITNGKTVSDTVTLSDSGTITLPAYIDATYFASDYMATTQGF